MITYFSNNTGNMGGKWSPKEVEIREEEIKKDVFTLLHTC